MKKIDINNWNRKEHFDMFNNMDIPYVNLTANLDITKFYPEVKKDNFSFFRSILYLLSKAANEIEEFRYRIVDNEIFVYDSISPSFTLLNDDNTYSYCKADYYSDFSKFQDETRLQMEKTKNNKQGAEYEKREDLLYVTSIPWISFTNILHPVNTRGDSIPRIAIGKYFNQGDKMLLPFSVQVHHGLMDGYHIGLYFQNLQDLLVNFRDNI